MSQSQSLKPQDILVLLKILTKKGAAWRQVDIAHDLGMSQSEVAMALERAKFARLLDPSKRNVMKEALSEFLFHGLKYVYPAQPGALVRGIPTAHSAKPLASVIRAKEEDIYVWPDGNAQMRGQAIEPLYPSVPIAAQRDPQFYELLALIDVLRVGRIREQKLAEGELRKRLN